MAYKIIVHIVIFQLMAVSSNTDQVFHISEGQDVTLPCTATVENTNLHSLYWQKDDVTVYSMRNNMVVINSRNYSITNGISLRISDLVETDSGNYSCKVVDLTVINGRPVQLKVIGGKKAEMNVGTTEETTNSALSIWLPIVIILIIITFAVLIIFGVYRYRKKGISFVFRDGRFQRTTTPMSDNALDDLRFSTLQHRMKSVEEDLHSVDVPLKDFNEEVIFADAPELSFILVGQVLLDDLRSSSEKEKKSLKAVIIRLLKKRAKPYKECQLPTDASTPLNASLLQSSMRESMTKDGSTDKDLAFVELVLQKLDQILDETDRDECEILITKPDLREITDESQIPDYEGNRIINRSTQLQTSMRSSMNRSRQACSIESSVIREELRTKTPPERIDARNAICRIILETMEKGRRAKLLNRSDVSTYTEDFFHSPDDLVDDVARVVALWASKIAKLDDDINTKIEEYLFPLPTRLSETKQISDTSKQPVDTVNQGSTSKQDKNNVQGAEKEQAAAGECNDLSIPKREDDDQLGDEVIGEPVNEQNDESMKGLQAESTDKAVDNEAISLDDSFQK
ncbi:uncharacterized protein LOC121424327 [Lytechinus variegatus]|uniref:uncharacterized protein LOC121424327 n=1 Tax=Lytechinus variegatus TaxID=7654 RepID=UPI001BB1492E|nr:uncharacterized protein LOC121424327 [Lytechinus variegatus]